MPSTKERPASLWPAAGPHESAPRPRRWRFRLRSSRMDKVLERNAKWAAEARYTPPLSALESF
jgi:hypothetical protein